MLNVRPTRANDENIKLWDSTKNLTEAVFVKFWARREPIMGLFESKKAKNSVCYQAIMDRW